MYSYRRLCDSKLTNNMRKIPIVLVTPEGATNIGHHWLQEGLKPTPNVRQLSIQEHISMNVKFKHFRPRKCIKMSSVKGQPFSSSPIVLTTTFLAVQNTIFQESFYWHGWNLIPALISD